MKSNLISQREYARRRGWSSPYIAKLVKHGMIPTEGKKIDPKKADAALAASKLNQPRGNVEGTLTEAVRRRTLAQAQLKELELRQRSGEFVSLVEVQAFATKVFLNIRNRLLQMPGKLGQRLPLASDQRGEAVGLIRSEIHDTLTELSRGVGLFDPIPELCSRCKSKLGSRLLNAS